MNTKLDERSARSDLDDERPDLSQLDWSRAEVGRYSRKPGEKTEIFVDGAAAYQLRSIPSNIVLARFERTIDAWPVIIGTVERGRSPRTLAFDAILTDGRAVLVSAGPRLEMWARHNNGESVAHQRAPRGPARRVAEI